MLILVAVTVTVAINGGLFNTAKEAARGTENAKIFEQIQMAVVASRKVSDEIPYEELFDLLDNMKNSGNLDEETYALYEKFLKLMQQDKPVHAYFRLCGLNDSDMETIDEYLDNGEILEAYCKYATIVCETEFTKTDLMELLQQEEGITTEEEGKKYIINMFTEESKYMKEEIEKGLYDWKTNDLNRSKLLKELEPIMEEYKEIKKEEFGTNIIINNVNGKFTYTNDWAIVLKYGGVRVTILGTGEIIGPEEEISEAAQDPVVGDITDGGKRTGSQYNPYLIASIEDLVGFSKNVNEGNTYEGKYIELAIDLDFKDSKSYKNAKDTSFGDLNGDGTVKGIQEELTDENGKGFTPIGKYIDADEREEEKEIKSFNGVFDGNYHEIRNIYINNSENTHLALFPITNGATIRRLILKGGKIINGSELCIHEPEHAWFEPITYNYTAAFVGVTCEAETYVEECGNELDILTGINAENTIVIGIASSGDIKKCYNRTNITATYEACGITYYGDATNCYNVGNIMATGGRDLCNDGDSESSYGHASGIGYGSSAINCYNSGNVLNTTNFDYISISANGLCVFLEWGVNNMQNCYNLGAVTCAEGNAYGIVASVYGGSFYNIYNSGDVNSTTAGAYGTVGSYTKYSGPYKQGTIMSTGKILGKTGAFGNNASGNISDSYYLTGQVYVDGVQKADDEYAKTQEEMDSLMKPILEVINSTATNYYGNIICEGNAFVEDTNNINNGLPILKWQVEH